MNLTKIKQVYGAFIDEEKSRKDLEEQKKIFAEIGIEEV